MKYNLSSGKERVTGVKSSGKRYRFMHHEADTALAVYGDTYEEVFTNGAHGIFTVINDLRRVRKRDRREFFIPEGPDALIHLLNELLFLWDTGRFIPREVKVTRTRTGLRAVAEGETFDPSRHRIKKEVKAVTYHQFSFEKTAKGYEARLVLDI
jgi:SHS2 domain-containing protein